MDKTSIQAFVYATLKSSILCLKLKPGAVVSTQEIATKLSVSRTPVREAFIRLQRDGLVNIFPQKETVVSRINLRRIEQERFIRESLECANIDTILRRGGPYDLSALYKNIQEQKRVLAEEYLDGYKFFTIDNEFHRMLFALGGQELSAQVVADTNTHYTRVRLVTLGNAEIARASILEHEMILSEIESNLGELARGHMRHHLHRLEHELKAFVEKYPDYFESGEEESTLSLGTIVSL